MFTSRSRMLLNIFIASCASLGVVLVAPELLGSQERTIPTSVLGSIRGSDFQEGVEQFCDTIAPNTQAGSVSAHGGCVGANDNTLCVFCELSAKPPSNQPQSGGFTGVFVSCTPEAPDKATGFCFNGVCTHLAATGGFCANVLWGTKPE